MRIELVAVGRRPPAWVAAGYQEYARRLPRDCALFLREIPAARRERGADVAALVRREGERMLERIPPRARVIALDERGQAWTTRQLASRLQDWRLGGQDIALLVGGPDGLAPACMDRAEASWSLSPLTLPHFLVRVLVAEQIYRAWSLNAGHPYHRE
ncbi:MAG TPA: 23S rRNA (pseudouridine(1915)-N(3))-methyltransferase RlmH [Gammaproteobacteria bacterium]|nr:23S rRNA (pseudouridine(1915)-N(3))-methyltransferase RlmH [Gammaproteobacteria bacterium]